MTAIRVAELKERIKELLIKQKQYAINSTDYHLIDVEIAGLWKIITALRSTKK